MPRMKKAQEITEKAFTEAENVPEAVAAGKVAPTETAPCGACGTAERQADVFRGVYRTTEALNLRAEADAEPIIAAMPKGTTVNSSGGYMVKRGVRWLYVETEIDGKEYAGFCMIRFLERI